MVNSIVKPIVAIKYGISSWIYVKAFNIRFEKADDPDCLNSDSYTQTRYKKAFKLFMMAAKLGHDDAQHEVSRMYRDGLGVNVDKQLFEYWAIRAYYQGHAMALFDLADYHRTLSKIVKSDVDGTYFSMIDLAYDEYELLAKSDVPEAQEILGDMYSNGEGDREPDLEKALYWYELAASNDMDDAIEQLKVIKGVSGSTK